MKNPMPPLPSASPRPGPACFYNAEGYKPEESVGYLMRQVLNHIGHQIEHELAHTELTNAQWVPLFKLYSNQASTVAELARVCQLDAGATTRLLDRLEAKGLCRRTRSDTDRRVVNIVLTDAGTVAAQDIPRVLSGVQNANLAGFSTEEFETLKSFLRRILANAKNTCAQAQDASQPGDSHAS